MPDAASFALALRALFRPGNVSAVHVVGLPAAPRTIFPSADIVRAELSAEGFARLLDRLDASFARGADRALPEDLGPGFSGPACFFAASKPFTPSTSAIIGWPRCSPPPVCRSRRCSRPCRRDC